MEQRIQASIGQMIRLEWDERPNTFLERFSVHGIIRQVEDKDLNFQINGGSVIKVLKGGVTNIKNV